MNTYYESIEMSKEAIKQLETVLKPLYPNSKLTFGLGKAGNGYASYHVVLDGITYGRITFKEGKIYNVKHYKPFGYPFDENDLGEFLFLRIKTFYDKGIVLSYFEIKNLIKKASDIISKELAAKKLYREQNPCKYRRKVSKEDLLGRY